MKRNARFGFIRRMWRDRATALGIVLLVAFVILAVGAAFFATL